MQSLPQVDIPMSSVSSGGMHARTITLAKGTILTGAIHLSDHLNVMHGDITIVGESGAQRYTGSHVIASGAGTKRVGFVHADTVWTTILKTDDADADEVKGKMTTNEFDDPRLVAQQPLEMIGN